MSGTAAFEQQGRDIAPGLLHATEPREVAVDAAEVARQLFSSQNKSAEAVMQFAHHVAQQLARIRGRDGAVGALVAAMHGPPRRARAGRSPRW